MHKISFSIDIWQLSDHLAGGRHITTSIDHNGGRGRSNRDQIENEIASSCKRKEDASGWAASAGDEMRCRSCQIPVGRLLKVA